MVDGALWVFVQLSEYPALGTNIKLRFNPSVHRAKGDRLVHASVLPVCDNGSVLVFTAENHVTSKQQQWRIPLNTPSIQVRFSLIFPVLLVRFANGV